MTNHDDIKYWLALSFIKDTGPITLKRLLSVFHSPERILKASFKELREVEDIGELRAKRIYKFNSWNTVEEEIEKINNHNIRIITYADREYPENLRHIDDSPIILYAKGSIIKDDRYAIAIVGSRLMTEYGRSMANKIASELSSLGITIVSGMARGIDTVAHKGALKAGGRSIAVLGCGLDKPYPPENMELFEALSHSGSVISEFPLGTPPNKENFPKRNRLISGLSLGVLVVEAAINSGSLITTGYAIEQGKDVFAIPGNITSRHSEGTNSLIKKGAKLVQNVDDILEEIAPQFKNLIPKNSKEFFSKNLDRLEITNEEKAICNILGSEPKHIDTIVRETSIPTARLSGLLLGLEMKGIVKQADGKRFYLDL